MLPSLGARSAQLCLSILGAVAVFASGSAASSSALRGRTVSFACDDGAHFSVAYLGGHAQITTSAGRWVLERRRSSIGRRYSSETATFVHDEDRAALNGLPGGPFRRCREAGARLAAETGDPRQ